MRWHGNCTFRDKPLSLKKLEMDLKKIILGFVALLLVVACSAGVSIFTMKYLMDQQMQMAQNESGEAAETEEPPQYISLQPIVVNYAQGADLRYLQLSIELMTRDDTLAEDVKTNMPEIRNALIMELSGQTYEMLVTRDGKQHLRDMIREEVNLILGGEDQIESVLITSFVMQ